MLIFILYLWPNLGGGLQWPGHTHIILLYKTIKSNIMKMTQKVVNNLINENIYPLKQDGW